jgi:hypothetical protein
MRSEPPLQEIAQFGPSSKFGFENPFQFFNLQPDSSVLLFSRFGISSVSATAPLPPKKIRYVSSSYWPIPPQTTLLIIGRSKVQILLGPPFFTVFKEL